MGATRIQQKSRPTKRPQAFEDNRTYSGRPRADKKGFPATEGVPIPVLVKGFVDGPAGTTDLGTWVVGAGANDGEFDFTYPEFIINDLNEDGTDQSAVLLALVDDDEIWMETPTGLNLMTVASIADGGDFVTITLDAETPVGFIDDGQSASIWMTDNS
jgi:hypothetical protein